MLRPDDVRKLYGSINTRSHTGEALLHGLGGDWGSRQRREAACNTYGIIRKRQLDNKRDALPVGSVITFINSGDNRRICADEDGPGLWVVLGLG